MLVFARQVDSQKNMFDEKPRVTEPVGNNMFAGPWCEQKKQNKMLSETVEITLEDVSATSINETRERRLFKRAELETEIFLF